MTHIHTALRSGPQGLKQPLFPSERPVLVPLLTLPCPIYDKSREPQGGLGRTDGRGHGARHRLAMHPLPD